jgi:hypothetical protein
MTRERLVSTGKLTAIDLVTDTNEAKLEIITATGETWVFSGILKTPHAKDLKEQTSPPIIVQEPQYPLNLKRNFTYEGLWFCSYRKRFVIVQNRIGTIYNQEGLDLQYDKAVIDDRGHCGNDTGFLDIRYSGTETMVRGTNIRWPENLKALVVDK